MANYTLIPSAIEKSSGGDCWYEDPDYAYHNTSWTQNYMWFGIFAYGGHAGNGYVFLKGFDFSNVDTSLDYSVTVKVKAATADEDVPGYVTATLYSSENGVALSQETTLPLWKQYSADPSVTTLTLTATASTIISYGGTVGIKFRAYDGSNNSEVCGVAWGAEIILTEQEPEPVLNKIITATAYSTTNVATVTDASNAYTDTTSSTYAQVTTTSSSASKAYFYGFDFSQIPNGATITSVTYKIKVKTVGTGGSTFYVFLENRNTSSELSAKTSTASITSETVVTLTPTSATWSDIVAMGDNFAFCVQHSRTTRTQNVYGIEIDVTYTTPEVNKVIYGNNTLIDLTGDTATASDVASGKTFHLANGRQEIGTASDANIKTKTQTLARMSSNMNVSGLDGEPSWFFLFEVNTSEGSPYRIVSVYYDGNNVSYVGAWSYSNSTSMYVWTDTSISFSYSNGTLSLLCSHQNYKFGSGQFKLLYMV